MEDENIVALYLKRDEKAIRETADKYGSYLRTIALNILANTSDSEECVSDCYLKAWNAIPPERPQNLAAFLGKIVRRSAIDLLRRETRQKRGGSEYELSLDELDECVSGIGCVESQAELRELSASINVWLRSLPQRTRDLFLCRYYYADSLKDAAAYCGISESSAKGILCRARQSLRNHLEKENYSL